MPADKTAASAATTAQFQNYYLQRATTELAEDLDALRTADDFAMATGKARATASAGGAVDTPLQMLIEALRQGAEMFGVEDQQRVVSGGTSNAEASQGAQKS